MKITKKYLKNKYPMADLDCLSLGKKYGKNWWISYTRLEEDTYYYNFGCEDSNTKDEGDTSFEFYDSGLVSIEHFLDIIKSKKLYLKNIQKDIEHARKLTDFINELKGDLIWP